MNDDRLVEASVDDPAGRIILPSWTTEDRLRAIHISVWLFGILQLLIDLALILAIVAAPARADSGQDDQFFSILAKYHIGYESREDAISGGQAFCGALDRGATFGELETVLIDNSGTATSGRPQRWTVRTADQALFAAASAYCPQYVGLVPQASLVPQ